MFFGVPDHMETVIVWNGLIMIKNGKQIIQGIEILLPKIEKEINNKKRKLSSFLLLELKNIWKKKITR